MLFLKEGVFFSIDALLTQEKRTSKLMCPVFSSIQLDSSQKSASRQALKCWCYAFSSGQPSSSSEVRNCKLDKHSVYNLAKHIKTTYLVPELCDSHTNILQNLRALSNDLLSIFTGVLSVHEEEEKTKSILSQIMDKFTGKEQVSTFEFIESGVLKSLADYLSQGQYMRNNNEMQDDFNDNGVIEKRFETLASVCLSGSLPFSGETTISVLIRNLQTALVSLEAFPVILSSGLKLRDSFVIVPKRRPITYPCLKVCFVKGKGETFPNEYTEEFRTVDPFSSLHSIEGYLWPMVSSKCTEYAGSSSIYEQWQLRSPQLYLPVTVLIDL